MLVTGSQEQIEDLGKLGNRLDRFLFSPYMSDYSLSWTPPSVADNLLEYIGPWLIVYLSTTSGSPSQFWIME